MSLFPVEALKMIKQASMRNEDQENRKEFNTDNEK